MGKYKKIPWKLGGCSGRMIMYDVPNPPGDGFVADVDTLENAQLMVAAPEILEALKAFLNVDITNQRALAVCAGNAEKAIAKAEGQPSV